MSLQTPASPAPAAGARLRCIGCGAVTERPAANFCCTACGDLWEVFYPSWAQAELLPDVVACKSLWLQRRQSFAPRDQSGVWRFRELLPIVQDFSRVVTLREGNTPVFELPRCARAAGLERLLAKHQGMNPTGSFKDTGMTAAISVARELGYEWVACASTGNTSASMAAYAARGGMKSLVLIPAGKIAWGKLSQCLEYGAVTCQLRTDFDGCLRLLDELVHRLPIYLLNSMNPYRLEGQKTAAVELLEQMDWRVPDHVVIPGGNLANSSAIGKMFLELRQLGFISSLPRVSIIQAQGANPLVRTLRERDGTELVRVQAETHATAIRIGSPASWRKAIAVLRATGGFCEEVSEAEIAIAKAEIGADGVGCEPASAVTLAGVKRLVAQGKILPHQSVVLILTGHLLKDAEYTLNFHRGELLGAAEVGAEELARLKPLQRTPLVLDSDADAILRALEADSEKK